MSFIRYIQFPLGIHLLQGLAIPADLLLGHNLKILGLPNQLEGMMAQSSCLLKSMLLSQDAMKALKAYYTEAINRVHQRKVHNTETGESPHNEHPEPSVPNNDPPDLPETGLDIPDDLNFVNSQCHSS